MAVDNPPVLAGIETTTLSYSEGDAATAITSTINISDPDNTTISSAKVSITGGFSSGEDVLGFTNQNGITGSYNAATGVLTLLSSAGIEGYQAALRSVTYKNTSVIPSTSDKDNKL